MDCDEPRTDETSPIDEGYGDAQENVAADGGTSGLDSRGTRAENQLGPGYPPLAFSGQQVAISSGTTMPGDTVQQKAQKTARSEAVRKALLEEDPWTLTVEPTQVECGGCNQIIKLDGRSRYYPGLWEKHRDRCEKVREKRAALVEVSFLVICRLPCM